MPQGGIRECMVAEAGHHNGHGVHGMTAGAQRKKRAQVRIACTHCQKACKKCSDQRYVTEYECADDQTVRTLRQGEQSIRRITRVDVSSTV